MSGKRALVVDDSKSARAFLSRLLEKHELEVDSAESAEAAIDYLTRHTPDVIFMDHLMPGMDGFQAVQAIKNNPRTATIPILMYTSQEGELYLGQARALGAIGVLPKQIAPADVKKVLHQLKLLPDLRSGDRGFRTVEELVAESGTHESLPDDGSVPDHDTTIASMPAPAALADGGATTAQMLQIMAEAQVVSPAVDVLLRDQIAELRRYVATGFDEQATRVVEQLSQVVRDAVPPPPAPPVVDRRGWSAAIAAGVVALVFAGLWWRESGERRDLQSRLSALAAPAAAPVAAPAAPAGGSGVAQAAEPAGDAASGAAAAMAATRAAGDVVAAVPYGEAPFAGNRTERLRALVGELAAADFRGRLDLRSHPARFCLAGNAAEGFSLAPPDLPQAQCDLVGNPAEEGRQPRESVMFANAVTELRRIHAGRIAIDVDVAREDAVVQPYPEAPAGGARAVTAGEWNAAASANNRVVIRWSATP
jgi:CheY-like chemotaxis protein